jgi:arginyl-tRNA synthetase
MNPTDALRAAVAAAARSLIDDEGHGSGALRTEPTLERPKKAAFGDFSSNVALLLAPTLGAPPRDVATRVGEALGGGLGAHLERFEVAGPGFLNLFLSDAWHIGALAHVLDAGEGFGAGGAEHPQRINVEFVSANPTGPLHVGHTRNAAYGDALARVLTRHGHDVAREFYINDFGSQILKLAESLRARARGEEVGEGGYVGDYVIVLADEIEGAADMDLPELGRLGVARNLEHMRESLTRFRVSFDIFFSERTLHDEPVGEDTDSVTHAFAALEQLGQTYTSDGALWLRTSAHGDDKDRPLVRSTGEHTYFASDIAYHQNKRERGFERLIDVWGADHHGYVQRMKAAYEALGGDRDALELIIMQFVHLVARGGERASMSKRAGEFVTLDELVDEIGVDAARWFLLQRSHDTTIDLDLDLARSQSAENPVFYVQYAHARIESVKRKTGEAAVAQATAQPGEPGVELHASERELIQKLLAFPAEVAEAAERRAPHRIATYALELAQAFTAFYRDCHVVGEPEAVQRFRLAECVAAQRTIAVCLELLGISAPAEM